jgi:Uma2 family endonuclease
MALTGRRLTLDEFLALPEEKPALEYLDGVVTQKVSPKMHHSNLQSFFVEVVNVYGRPRRLALAFTELRVTFFGPRWSPVPDVSVYRWGRIPRQADGKLAEDTREPWDIAVEIVSPEQRVGDLLKKCLRYADVGVAVSLVVDVDDETMYALRPGQPLRVLQGDDRIDLDDVLPGLDLTVRALFDSIVPDWLVAEPSSDV